MEIAAVCVVLGIIAAIAGALERGKRHREGSR